VQNANGRVKSAKFVFYIFSEAFCVLRKFLEPLKWYPDRNFFGDGGGVREVVKNIFSGKIFLALRCAEFDKKYKIGCGCALLCSLVKTQQSSFART
jgi:hypothetical protein